MQRDEVPTVHMVRKLHKTVWWLAVAAVGSGCLSTAPPTTEAAKAPALQRLDGSAQPFAALLGDKRQLLLVYTTVWDERGRKERPEVEAWATRHKTLVKVISINSGSRAKKVREHLARHAVTIDQVPLYIDASARLAEYHRIHATPTLVLFGVDGVEVGRYESIAKVPVPKP